MFRILLVDGYNIINQWEDLRQLGKENMEEARLRLVDALSRYGSLYWNRIVVIYDAYRVKTLPETFPEPESQVQVYYTRRGETADHLLEKLCLDNRDRGKVEVASSDRLVLHMAGKAGAGQLSAAALGEKLRALEEEGQRKFAGGNQQLPKSPINQKIAQERLENLLMGEKSKPT